MPACSAHRRLNFDTNRAKLLPFAFECLLECGHQLAQFGGRSSAADQQAPLVLVQRAGFYERPQVQRYQVFNPAQVLL